MKPTTAILVALAIAAPTAQAATIMGSLGTLQGFFSHYDLEDINGRNDTAPDTQTTDWVIYGARSGSTLGYTTKLETSSFSTLSGATYNQAVNGVLKFKRGAGFGSDPDANAGADYGVGADDNATAAGTSFTYTLSGGDATMLVYLHGLNSLQDSYDFNASITGSTTAPLVWTDIALPTQVVSATVGNRDGDYGILTLQITDAQPGDVLTFNFSTNYSEELAAMKTPDGSWGVGIGGASVYAAVPEPSSLLLLCLGAPALLRRRR